MQPCILVDHLCIHRQTYTSTPPHTSHTARDDDDNAQLLHTLALLHPCNLPHAVNAIHQCTTHIHAVLLGMAHPRQYNPHATDMLQQAAEVAARACGEAVAAGVRLCEEHAHKPSEEHKASEEHAHKPGGDDDAGEDDEDGGMQAPTIDSNPPKAPPSGRAGGQFPQTLHSMYSMSVDTVAAAHHQQQQLGQTHNLGQTQKHPGEGVVLEQSDVLKQSGVLEQSVVLEHLLKLAPLQLKCMFEEVRLRTVLQYVAGLQECMEELVGAVLALDAAMQDMFS